MGQGLHELRHVAAAYDAFHQFDVVHDHTIAGLLSTFRPAHLPTVATCHSAFDADTSDLYGRLAADLALVAISHDQASRAPATVVPTAVIHHGIDASRYPFSASAGGSLLFLGRMDPTKGVHIAALAARRAGLPLAIAAKMRTAEERRYFREFVQPLLDDSITYVGEVGQQEKLSRLRSARALVNPICWPEPFGLVMLEALACGTPVVGYDSGAAPEIVEHGVTGYLVRDEDGLADALSAVEHIDRRRCQRSAMTQFSADVMVARYVNVYRAAIAEHAAHVSRPARAIPDRLSEPTLST
jgi:glycosyltransferase involved in cell wall biosynthesis